MSPFARLKIDDIARLAQVSRTTASMVLNGQAERYRIAPATVERVKAVAAEHNYIPSQSARALRSRKSRTLGLVIPELTNFAHASLAQALEVQSRAAGYQLLIATSNDDPEQEGQGIAQLAAREVDGLIIVPASAQPQQYQGWQTRLPLVFADRRIEGSGIPFVVSDAVEVVAELTAQTLAAAHAEAAGAAPVVAFFGGQPELSPSRDRLAGFRAALARAGLPEAPGAVIERDYRRSSGQAMMAEWRERHDGHVPRVLFTGGIALLEGVLADLQASHLLGRALDARSHPLHLITFDDHPLLDCLPLPVLSIAQDAEGLAAQSLKTVLAIMQGERPESAWVPARVRQRQVP
ncbi:MAG: Catabolite repressor/activator [Paracidovorax wautersii]|uniref:Catabolite repressor/activator n=1 Tax=Paracidovorax wautersii TaxID=1177982 RepID=A0A7V8FPH1_9BURK|nr:MAG: Catabolite repressor/activator [Paracidovorax wautersii]